MDYILLGKGELAVMSYKLDHPGLDFLPLASGKLVCIVPEGHPLLTSPGERTGHGRIPDDRDRADRPLWPHHVRPVRA